MLDETGYVPEWKYAPGEEIRRHAVRIAEKFDLYADAVFSTAVTSLTWDETSQAWIVTTDRGDKFGPPTSSRRPAPCPSSSSPASRHRELQGTPSTRRRWDYAYTGGTRTAG
ncbi:hypothetical protein GCM10023238_26970 [Streptomyces heliomycini]